MVDLEQIFSFSVLLYNVPDLVDMFVDESVVQKTMAVVKPIHGSAGSNTIVKEQSHIYDLACTRHHGRGCRPACE